METAEELFMYNTKLEQNLRAQIGQILSREEKYVKDDFFLFLVESSLNKVTVIKQSKSEFPRYENNHLVVVKYSHLERVGEKKL